MRTVIFVLAVLTSSIAFAQNIPVANPSFENPALASNDWTTSVPGWALSPGSSAGVFNPPASALTNGATDGSNVLWINQGSVYQLTAATVQAGVTYSLSTDVCQRADKSVLGYSISLRAGTTVLATDNSTMQPPAGQCLGSLLNYTAASNEPSIGQPITIEIDLTSGSQADFDNVRFSASQNTTRPIVSWINPSTSLPSKPISIFGLGFGAIQGTVLLGSSRISVVTWSDTQVVAMLPAVATTSPVQVVSGGYTSNAVPLTILPPGVAVAGIANASFEDPPLAANDWTTSVHGWTLNPGSSAGVVNPSPSSLANGAPEGSNILWINEGSVSQLTAASVQAGVTYALSVNVCQRTDDAATGYFIDLRAGSNILVADNGTLQPLPGQAMPKPLP